MSGWPPGNIAPSVGRDTDIGVTRWSHATGEGAAAPRAARGLLLPRRTRRPQPLGRRRAAVVLVAVVLVAVLLVATDLDPAPADHPGGSPAGRRPGSRAQRRQRRPPRR